MRYLRLRAFTRGILIVLVMFSLLTLILLYQGEINDKRLRDNIDGIIHDPTYGESLKLNNFQVYNQLYSWSCGPTTISMVYTYLKEPKDENQILSENKLTNRNSGMFPSTFEKYLGDSLQGYSVELKSNISDSEVIKILYNQLKQGLPVPIYFSTVNDWDKPNYDTHYSAVIGIDLRKKTVTIANAYGFKEEVNLNIFLDSLKYDNYKNKPLAFRLAAITGIIKKNNVYIINKI